MLPALLIIASAAVVLVLIYLLADRAFSAPRYRGPTTNHFDGRKFHNLEPPAKSGFVDFLRRRLNGERGRWNEWTDNEHDAATTPRVDGKDLRVTFVNHATVLIQTEGLNILTDPVWSERVSPIAFAGPARRPSFTALWSHVSAWRYTSGRSRSATTANPSPRPSFARP
jgi:hypothetical protein